MRGGIATGMTTTVTGAVAITAMMTGARAMTVAAMSIAKPAAIRTGPGIPAIIGPLPAGVPIWNGRTACAGPRVVTVKHVRMTDAVRQPEVRRPALVRWGLAGILLVLTGGCVAVAPDYGYGYGYAPAYSPAPPAYSYAPAPVVVAPPVVVRPYYRPYYRDYRPYPRPYYRPYHNHGGWGHGHRRY